MKSISVSFLLLLSAVASAQSYRLQNFDQTVHGLTTIVSRIESRSSTTYAYSGYGTGFFYHKYKNPVSMLNFAEQANGVDSSLKSIWLITNKHVVFGKENATKKDPPYPAMIEFSLRKKIPGQDNPVWDTIRIRYPYLLTRIRLHSDSLVDVVAIDVTREVLSYISKGDSLYYYAAVSEANFPHPEMPLSNDHAPTTGTEVLAIGYPRKFYDLYNLFPTVKAGIIASKWQAKYGGKPYFLIDCKLFPGSSGSIVISHHRHFDTPGKKTIDWFEFLGVYSGELYRELEMTDTGDTSSTKREYYNTGNVWYYYLIEEMIN